MKPEEANELARWMAGLFPSLTPEQVIEWATEFERCEVADVRWAVAQHHRLTADGFVKPAGLMDGIRAEASRRTIEQRQADSEIEKANAEASWQTVRAAIDAAGDDYLAAKKAELLPRLSPSIRRIVEPKPVRESKLLMALIYEDLQREKAHV